jgi:hypothetical protein
MLAYGPQSAAALTMADAPTAVQGQHSPQDARAPN